MWKQRIVRVGKVPFLSFYFQHGSARVGWEAASVCTLLSCSQEVVCRTSLVAQWLRIHLPMQGTRVRALVREDPTCRGAAKPVRHNY